MGYDSRRFTGLEVSPANDGSMISKSITVGISLGSEHQAATLNTSRRIALSG